MAETAILEAVPYPCHAFGTVTQAAQDFAAAVFYVYETAVGLDSNANRRSVRAATVAKTACRIKSLMSGCCSKGRRDTVDGRLDSGLDRECRSRRKTKRKSRSE
jgi:hypothetical protein